MKDNNALLPLVKRFSIMSAMLVLAQSVVQRISFVSSCGGAW